ISAKGSTMNRIYGVMRSFVAAATLGTVPTGAWAQETKAEPEYDMVIRGGRVLGGAGNPCIFADVAIRHGRFVKIGRIDGSGKTEIAARGRYVSPGWIDMMDQSGAALLKNGLAENKLMEGVTTAIAGEGGTPVPADRLLEYWAELEKDGISLNF